MTTMKLSRLCALQCRDSSRQPAELPFRVFLPAITRAVAMVGAGTVTGPGEADNRLTSTATGIEEQIRLCLLAPRPLRLDLDGIITMAVEVEVMEEVGEGVAEEAEEAMEEGVVEEVPAVPEEGVGLERDRRAEDIFKEDHDSSRG